MEATYWWITYTTNEPPLFAVSQSRHPDGKHTSGTQGNALRKITGYNRRDVIMNHESWNYESWIFATLSQVGERYLIFSDICSTLHIFLRYVKKTDSFPSATLRSGNRLWCQREHQFLKIFWESILYSWLGIPRYTPFVTAYRTVRLWTPTSIQSGPAHALRLRRAGRDQVGKRSQPCSGFTPLRSFVRHVPSRLKETSNEAQTTLPDDTFDLIRPYNKLRRLTWGSTI